jgi:hypothetical protein|nr:MAG TPA: hypothetical protein [Caudoviricetes sp.]
MNEKLNLFLDLCNSDEQIRMSCLKYAVCVYEAQHMCGSPLKLAQVFYDWVTSQEEKRPE